MLERLVILGGIVAVALVAVGLVVLLGMRAKSPLVLRPLILLQRKVINPRQMRSAGAPGAYASVIRHRGRVSGLAYETPVDAVPTDDGFLIALVYGSRTDWLRNVLATGSATIVHDGQATQVDRPEVVPMHSVEARFKAGDRRGFRWLAIDEALRVHRVEPGAVGERAADALDFGATGAPAADDLGPMGARHGA